MTRKNALSTVIIAAIAGLLVLPISAQDNQDEAKRFYRIGLAALEDNDLKIASSNLVKASALAPSNALIKYNLGIVLSMANDNEGARTNLEAAIKLGLDAKAKDAAEALLAKVMYKLEKSSSLLSQIVETWKGRVALRTAVGPRGETLGENLRDAYVVSAVGVNGCTVTVSFKRTQSEGRGDRWVPTGEPHEETVSVPMATVTRLEASRRMEGFIFIGTSNRNLTTNYPRGVMNDSEGGLIATGSGTGKLVELLTAFAKACNATILP